jgi:hypothetical protein
MDGVAFGAEWRKELPCKKSQIKVCLVLQKCKGAKNLYGGYPTKFAGSTQNPKKFIRTPNLPIRTKIFPKKVCLVP